MNEELKKMYESVVKEKLKAEWDDAETVARIDKKDRERKKRVKEIISAGELKVGADYHHAALIFQHGNTTIDFKKANELAKKGMELGDKRSKWLYAATLDRYLLSVGKPQRYGTQFGRNKDGEPEVAKPIDKNVTIKRELSITCLP